MKEGFNWQMTLITILPHTPFKKKNVLTFFIGAIISMGKGKKWFSLLRYNKSTFSFSQWNGRTYQKSEDIFFLKVGMGKKSYYCNLSIKALFYILYLVILLQFLAIVRLVENLKSDFLKNGQLNFFVLGLIWKLE